MDIPMFSCVSVCFVCKSVISHKPHRSVLLYAYPYVQLYIYTFVLCADTGVYHHVELCIYSSVYVYKRVFV